MTNIRVLISGASIAGPALASWLLRYGFDVTVVEKAAGIRAAGQAVDVKGPVHHAVLERMGVLDAVRRASVPSADGVIVDREGRRIGVVPGAFAGDINIPRGDLAGILYGLTAQEERCVYAFGDSITSLRETGAGVEVTFVRAAPQKFDLVVGADGIHSNVRGLAFGPEADYVTHLGHSYALAGLDAGDDHVMYNEPGRMAALGGDKAPAFFVFASGPLRVDHDDDALQKRQVVDAFRGGGWRLPELMAQIPDAEEFYVDSISRVIADRYTRGRVALVGDSAYANALGGFGTGLALVGAYVLAGELYAADGDYEVAYASYEAKFRRSASVSRKVNAGRLLAPSTRVGIRARNLLFAALARSGPLTKVVARPAASIALDDTTSASVTHDSSCNGLVVARSHLQTEKLACGSCASGFSARGHPPYLVMMALWEQHAQQTRRASRPPFAGSARWSNAWSGRDLGPGWPTPSPPALQLSGMVPMSGTGWGL